MDRQRRKFAQGLAAVAGIAAVPLAWAGDSVRIGFVSPQTGPLAPFGATDRWVYEQLRGVFAKGIEIGGRRYAVEIVFKDSQSSPNRAAQVTNDLILKDGVAMVLTAGTPETANPVSDTCELNGVPCVSTVVPWQSWFFGRHGNPARGFDWTYHFFWGLEDVIAAYTSGWKSVRTDHVVGGLFPNDVDGNAWGDPKIGFPGPLKEQGFQLIDPGRFQDGTQDFSAQISAFKSGRTDIITGVVIPPDAKTFLTQAHQQGLRPKVITLGKALLFPSTIDALEDLGDGLSTEYWWGPPYPFSSSLTGQSAKALAAAFEASTQQQWSQPIGFSHALFEVAADTLRRTRSLKASDLRDALVATRLHTVVGPVAWGGKGPMRNVSKTPLVLGQWNKGTHYRHELTIVNNVGKANIPVGASLRLL